MGSPHLSLIVVVRNFVSVDCGTDGDPEARLGLFRLVGAVWAEKIGERRHVDFEKKKQSDRGCPELLPLGILNSVPYAKGI